MVLNVFIVSYLLFVIFSDTASGSYLHRVASRLFLPAYWLGLRHTWSMYAPDPPFSTTVVEIVGVTPDGEQVNLTPQFLDLHDQLGRTPNLRYITAQMHLQYDYSAPMREELCRRAVAERPDVSDVRVVAYYLATPALTSPPNAPRQLSEAVLAKFPAHRSVDP